MAAFSIDAFADKIQMSVLCRALMRKKLLTYREFEEMALRSHLIDWIENMPDEEFKKRKWQLFEVMDPENKSGWKEQDDRNPEGQ